MAYTFRYASEDKWQYTGLDPVRPRIRSEMGGFINPIVDPPKPFQLLKYLSEGTLRGRRGVFGFGKKDECPHNAFLDVHFSSSENNEDEGLELSDFHFEDEDMGILVLPKKGALVPCQMESNDNCIFANAAENIDERCFVLSEDGRIGSVSLDPDKTDKVKIVPSVSFLSWAKPISGEKPRFLVKLQMGSIKITDNKRNRYYSIMPQTGEERDEADNISRLLNTIGFSAIVDRYPIRREINEDNRS